MALRAWIEQGFKITKRAGWQWQRTHMTKPERAARLWLAVAVATLWLLSVGGEAEETIPASTVPDVTALVPAQPRMRRATRLRLVQCLSPGLEPHPGGVARSGAAAHGALCPRTLAGRHGAGGAGPAPAGPGDAPGRLRSQAAGATGTCVRVKTWVSDGQEHGEQHSDQGETCTSRRRWGFLNS